MACASMPDGDAPPPRADLPDPKGESNAIEVRQELRRQISRLEAELASYTGHLRAGLRTAPRRAVAHVAGVQELEQTRDTLVAQLAAARGEAQERARERAQARGSGPLGRAMGWWRSRP